MGFKVTLTGLAGSFWLGIMLGIMVGMMKMMHHKLTLPRPAKVKVEITNVVFDIVKQELPVLSTGEQEKAGPENTHRHSVFDIDTTKEEKTIRPCPSYSFTAEIQPLRLGTGSKYPAVGES